MIELDGAVGEGGGQILRTALALALCTQQPVRIHHIRARRPKPGLMRQHLACVQAAVAISGANAVGADLGSQDLVFEPGPVKPGDYSFKVGTAGSCSLVLQTVLPPLMLATGTSRVALSGGTHNPMAPPFHFLERCFAPLLNRLGVGLTVELRRMGFYPAGGGEFNATITPGIGGPQAFDLPERGALQESYAECLSPGLPQRVAQRELHALGQAMGWAGEQLRTPVVRQNEGPGNALMATWVYEHASEVVTAFGGKGITSEAVARAVAKEALTFHAASGALGPHLADQWMLPLALAVAQNKAPAFYTCTEMTEHSRTNIGVIEALLPVRFEVVQVEHGSWRVSIAAPVSPA
jgi:RNA 3'-terminal phosphate cyclase (ATP)